MTRLPDALAQCLEATYNMVSAGIDVLGAYGEAQEGFLAERREFEAEMRSEYEAEMRAEYGNHNEY